jgi:hypothetical protein
MKLNIIIQSVIIAIMGIIILMSVPTITNVQATANQSLAETMKTCQARLLNEVQQLSEHQCLFFNSCLNSGGSIVECYNAARNINCDVESGKRNYCPGTVYGS